MGLRSGTSLPGSSTQQTHTPTHLPQECISSHLLTAPSSWTEHELNLLMTSDIVPGSFKSPILWIHICQLVAAIESSSDQAMPSIYKKLPQIIKVLQADSKLPTNLHRFLEKTRKKLEEARKSKTLVFLNVAVLELMQKRDIVSDECEAHGISVEWLLTKTSDHPQKPLQLTNGQAVALHIFRKSHNRTWKELCTWFQRITGKDCVVGALQTSLQALHDKKRKKQKKGSLQEFLQAIYPPPSCKTPCVVEQATGNISSTQNHNNPELDSLKNALADEMDTKQREMTENRRCKSEIRGLKRKLESQLQEQQRELAAYTNQLNETKADFKKMRTEKDTLQQKYNATKHGTFSKKNMKKREATSKTTIATTNSKLAVLKSEKQQLSKQLDLTINNHQEEIGRLTKEKDKELSALTAQFEEQVMEDHISAQCQIGELVKKVEEEKKKKRCLQKSRWHYKQSRNLLQTRLQEMDDIDVNKMMNPTLLSELENENEELREIIAELKEEGDIQTFKGGRYNNAIRLVCYDLLTHGVSSRNISHVIKAVVKHLTNKNLANVPSPTSIKRMAYECNILAKRQTADILSQTKNNTLLYDGTSKHQRKYMLYQISTDEGILTASIDNILSGDTETQLESTKEFLSSFSDLVSECGESISTEKLLFSIKNTMSDRAVVNKAYNAELQAWRESTLPAVIENYETLSQDQRMGLAKLNDFFCGLHFECHMGEAAESALGKWERIACGHGDEKSTAPIGMASLPKFRYWNFTTSHTQRFIRSVCDTFSGGRHANEQVGIPETFRAYLDGRHMFLSDFVGNRFNILFDNGAAVYHHRRDIHNVLHQVGKMNKMYDAIKADLEEDIILAGTRALGIMHVQITAPLWRILAHDSTHVLDMSEKYTYLEEKLDKWRDDPSELLNPDFVLFPKFPPKKDATFISLYDGLQEDSKTAEALSLLCGSCNIIANRQLADHLPGGKYNQPNQQLRSDTKSVPTTNIAPEHSFGHLDYLLRLKPNATIQHCGGIIAFKANKTMEYMSDGKLDSMVKQAIPKARMLQKDGKRKRTDIRKSKLQTLKDNADKKQDKEDKVQEKLVHLHDTVHEEGGLCHNKHDLEQLVKRCRTLKSKREALLRQVDYHKLVLKTNVPDKKMFNHKDGKRDFSVEQLFDKILELVSIHSLSQNVADTNTADADNHADPVDTTIDINELKQKMKATATEEREKALAALPKRAKFTFPLASSIVGNQFKHRFDKGLQSRWYRGSILRIANEDDLRSVVEEDKQYIGTHTFFVCRYDDGDLSVYPLFRDWVEHDIEFL